MQDKGQKAKEEVEWSVNVLGETMNWRVSYVAILLTRGFSIDTYIKG